eukprot:scaffold1673_cov85-Cylindrotheca_fusiformis.AAC.2
MNFILKTSATTRSDKKYELRKDIRRESPDRVNRSRQEEEATSERQRKEDVEVANATWAKVGWGPPNTYQVWENDSRAYTEMESQI